MLTFTDSQKLACDISRNIAVTAGAGSGKTSVLVERYLWCLQNNNYQVRRVVAITFTEKAAGEMLGRIREQVLVRITSGFGDPRRWEAVLEKLPVAPISTIHGFCQRLLREFPIEAGVDPNFEVYDEALKHIHLIRLVDDFLRQRSDARDPNLRILSDLWSSPRTLRDILVQLIETRERSLPWANQISQESFSNYLNRITALVEQTLQQGVQTITTSQAWQEAIETIQAVIPVADRGKLTGRCLSIFEYDAEFRQQTTLNEQIATLGMIRKNCSLIGVTKAWQEDNRNVRLKQAFDVLKTLHARHLLVYELQESLEQIGFAIQQALAKLLLEVYPLFQQEKSRRRLLDFDDLQEHALALLNNAEMHTLLARRYDYIMVDEFQDTNHLQWEIIKKLGISAQGLAEHKFCVVGDEKQSIYMFRGAEVSVFSAVRQELQQTNAIHHLLDSVPKIPERGDRPQWQSPLTGELIMAENFRSRKELIFFFNYLFARLFLPAFDPNRPYDVPHQKLLACRREEKNTDDSTHAVPVEFLLVDQSTQAETAADEYEEPRLIARRILELVQAPDPGEEAREQHVRRNFRDLAILLRTRTRLKEYEDALRTAQIPFIVAGGIGFYQQQEIYDLTNLLRVLSDTRQDIPLAGVLRSPLLNFSDDQLLYAATDGFTESRTEVSDKIPATLWEKLQFHANHSDLIPAELNPPQFKEVFRLLSTWKSKANKIPITHLLRQILDDTGLYGILAFGQQDRQASANIEKFLDLARNFEREGFQALSEFITYLDQLIETAEREGEAQMHAEGMNVVQLMTIHAAKGLEFPVVFVPELDRPFNYGVSESVYLDAIARTPDSVEIAAGIKGLHPEKNFEPETTVLREYLKRLNEEKTDAEMKRLLYVACTRAKEHLILSGTFRQKGAANSWLAWLNEIFPLQDALTRHSMMIIDETSRSDKPFELEIPVRTSIDALSLSISDAQKTATRRLAELEHLMDTVGSENPEPSPITQILEHNFHPLNAQSITLFQISPSTLYLLFQCPRKYYYQQILHLNDTLLQPFLTALNEEPASDEERDQAQQFGAQRGVIIHKLFEERFFDREMEIQERSAAIAGLLESMQISPQKREQMHLDDAIQHAYSSYVNTGLQQLLAYSIEIHREYPLYLSLGQARISGILDVLFRDPERQTWTILDYKTNEIGTEQIEEEIRCHGYDVQMQIYALAVSRLLQTDQVNGILFFTFPGCRYEAIDLSPSALKRFEEQLLTALQQLTKNPLEMTSDKSFCELCEYRRAGMCPGCG
ncbi:putative helicase [Candidatus Vecturithrix granuli]|uniref:DNA 3'-5' helicase n=1 Tax=Vecturithrix granuli TaxID=1499967 RepID=A0A081BZF0_VECG1|nr:putative helicase [Candidatus Vecturithrix granuli]